MVAWEASDRWVRQEGDNNYYGYPTVRPAIKTKFVVSANMQMTMKVPDYHWSNLTIDELLGSKAWEAKVLEAYGFLDTTMDPEPWPGAEEEEVQPPEAAGGQNVEGNWGEAGVEAAAAEDDSEIEGQDDEDDGSSMGNPPGNWGEPEPAGDAWQVMP